MKIIVTTILFLFTLISVSHAQWTQANGPYGGYCFTTGACGETMFMCGWRGGIYRSTDKGDSWTEVNGLPSTYAYGIASIDKTVFLCMNSYGVYRSSDDGVTWEAVNSGLPENPQKLYASGNDIYTISIDGVFRSTNKGNSWYAVPLIKEFKRVAAITVVDTNVFFAVGMGQGSLILRSSVNDTNWVRVDTQYPFQNSAVVDIAACEGNLFAGTYDGLFRSTDMGATWAKAETGLVSNRIKYLSVIGSTIFAGNYGGELHISKDNGKSWTRVMLSPSQKTASTRVVQCGTSIFTGTYGEGMFRSTDLGQNWTQINNGFANTEITGTTIIGNSIIAATRGSGMFLSSDKGGSWERINNGLTSGQITSVAKFGTTLYVTNDYGVFVSTDNGSLWKNFSSEYTTPSQSVFVTDSFVYIGATSRISSYYPDGTKYASVAIAQSDTLVTCFAQSGNVVFAGTRGKGVLFSTDNGKTWAKTTKMTFNDDIHTLTANNGVLYAGSYKGVSITADYGESWTERELGNVSNDHEVYAILVHGTEIFGGTEGSGLFRSPDSGKTWNKMEGLPSTVIYSLEIIGNTLFAGTYSSGIWKYDLNSNGITEQEYTGQSGVSWFTCYPNPATNTLTIDRTSLHFPENVPAHYTLSTLIGGKVMEYYNNEPRFTVQLGGVVSGVYSLTAESGGNRAAVMVTVVE